MAIFGDFPPTAWPADWVYTYTEPRPLLPLPCLHCGYCQHCGRSSLSRPIYPPWTVTSRTIITVTPLTDTTWVAY